MICPTCNAVNADDARFCGICGTALQRSSVPPVLARSGTSPIWPDTPTQPNAVPPVPITSGTSYAPAPYTQASVAFPVPVARRRPRGLRALIVIAVIVVLLVVGWAGLVRPALHRAAVNGLNAALVNAIQLIPVSAFPAGKSGRVTMTDADLAAAVALSGDTSPLNNVQAHFVAGALEISFKLWGFGNSIVIGLAGLQGAVNLTRVEANGPITLVISANDITAELTSALATVDRRLQGVRVSRLTIAPDLLALDFQS